MLRLTVTRPHQLAPSTEPNILCRIADDSAEREQPVTTYLVARSPLPIGEFASLDS
jgi:hypothetical protein